MEQVEIINKRKNQKVIMNEFLFIRILQISFIRDKRIYSVLKDKYEILFQKDFDETILDIKNC